MRCSACEGEIEQEAAYCGLCGSRQRARRTTLVGTVFAASYRIEEKLAEGGFGNIYRATHVSSGLDCALKVLHPELAADESIAARFRREGATLARLHDPHTVATYDVGESADGTLFIAMEWLRGESLHDRITSCGTLPWRTALGIIRQLCSALSEAHDLGIVHRDLKPANIHLCAGDNVKLLDFGIAKVAGGEVDDGGQLTRVGQTVGTLEYMAPEQIIGGSCEPRSDIYQLGVLMFEMVTGRRPFNATEPTAMITALLTLSPPPPSSVRSMTLPAELDALILRCLEREPEHRFTNVRELAAEIDKVLGVSDPALLVMPLDTVDEHTWIGGPTFSLVPTPQGQRVAPGLVPIGPAEVTPLPAFDVCVRGSVTEGVPLESTGAAIALAAYQVEEPPPPLELAPTVMTAAVVEAIAPTEPLPPAPAVAKRLPFAARLALWTIGLAATGAAIGAVLGLVVR